MRCNVLPLQHAKVQQQNLLAGLIPLCVYLAGVSLADFQRQYAEGSLKTVAELSGVPVENVKVSYAPAASGRRKLLQAGGVEATYTITPPAGTDLNSRWQPALGNDGSGFYDALSRNGVPLRPSITINGVQALAPAAPAASPAGLSAGALAGIIIGSVLGGLLIIAAIIGGFIMYRRKHGVADRKVPEPAVKPAAARDVETAKDLAQGPKPLPTVDANK